MLWLGMFLSGSSECLNFLHFVAVSPSVIQLQWIILQPQLRLFNTPPYRALLAPIEIFRGLCCWPGAEYLELVVNVVPLADFFHHALVDQVHMWGCFLDFVFFGFRETKNLIHCVYYNSRLKRQLHAVRHRNKCLTVYGA